MGSGSPVAGELLERAFAACPPEAAVGPGGGASIPEISHFEFFSAGGALDAALWHRDEIWLHFSAANRCLWGLAPGRACLIQSCVSET